MPRRGSKEAKFDICKKRNHKCWDIDIRRITWNYFQCNGQYTMSNQPYMCLHFHLDALSTSSLS